MSGEERFFFYKILCLFGFFRVNLEKLTFDFTVTMPSIKMVGKYKMTAKLPCKYWGGLDLSNYMDSNAKTT